MTLRRRILAGFGLTLGLSGVVMIWAVVNIVRLRDASEAILRENFQSILAAENMIDAIERQDSASLLMILGFQQEGLTQFRRNESGFLQWLARAKDNITIDGEQAILAEIDRGYADYLVEVSAITVDWSYSSGCSLEWDVKGKFGIKMQAIFLSIQLQLHFLSSIARLSFFRFDQEVLTFLFHL